MAIHNKGLWPIEERGRPFFAKLAKISKNSFNFQLKCSSLILVDDVLIVMGNKYAPQYYEMIAMNYNLSWLTSDSGQTPSENLKI